MKKKLFTLFVLLSFLAFSHPGRTDANGGHHDRKNGGYHYHHGYPAHDHPNGVCPYESKKSTKNNICYGGELQIYFLYILNAKLLLLI